MPYKGRSRKTRALGTRAQVMHNNAIHTSGFLTKKQLKYNKYGHIVSRKKSLFAKNNNHLLNYGYVPKKGFFRLHPKHEIHGTAKR